jgi:hypothetical protein
MTEKKQEKDRGGHKEDDIRSSISSMSKAAQARLYALIEKDSDAEFREHCLGAIGWSEKPLRSIRDSLEIPDSWNEVHVLDRMKEAFEILAMDPAATRPKAYGSAWPGYMPMTESELTGIKNEIFREGGLQALAEWEAERNRTKHVPSTAEITRRDQALRWPFEYLRDRPELAWAFSQHSQWEAMGGNIRRRCAQNRVDYREFSKNWQEGLRIITVMLTARHIPVS